MNEIMEKNLKSATMEQVAVIHTVDKDCPQTVAMVYVEKDWDDYKKAEYAFMETTSIVMGWWNSPNVVPMFESEDTVRSTQFGDQVLIGNIKYEYNEKFIGGLREIYSEDV